MTNQHLELVNIANAIEEPMKKLYTAVRETLLNKLIQVQGLEIETKEYVKMLRDFGGMSLYFSYGHKQRITGNVQFQSERGFKYPNCTIRSVEFDLQSCAVIDGKMNCTPEDARGNTVTIIAAPIKGRIVKTKQYNDVKNIYMPFAVLETGDPIQAESTTIDGAFVELAQQLRNTPFVSSRDDIAALEVRIKEWNAKNFPVKKVKK